MLNIVSQDGPTALTLAEQGLLFVVFALGALVRNDTKAEVFYKHAQAVAIEIVSETCAESAAFAFLTCLYQQTTGRIEVAWTTFGIAMRISQALGCLVLFYRKLNFRSQGRLKLAIVSRRSRVSSTYLAKYIQYGRLSKRCIREVSYNSRFRVRCGINQLCISSD